MAKQPPFSKEEIIRHFPNLPIEKVWDDDRLKGSFNDVRKMFINNKITDKEWKAYCVIWRNSVFRYSNICKDLEIVDKK
jgi:hypothetical protein